MTGVRRFYGLGVLLLIALSIAFAFGIVAGEATGGPGEDTGGWFFGGAMVGALLIAYSFIVLLLRKMGLVGPRKTER